MNKNLTSYLIPKLEKFLNDDLKLQKYLEHHFTASDLKGFEVYLQTTSNEDYELYSKVLISHNKEFCNRVENTIFNNINTFSIDTLESEPLIKFILSNKNLHKCLKKYLYKNPLRVLLYSDDFLSLIGSFISPHIQNNPGVIFVDSEDNVSFFLNNTSRTNYITLNLSFLRLALLELTRLYNYDVCDFHIKFNSNNKLTFYYGNSQYNCILVNKDDMNSIFNSFGYQNNKEKLQAVNMFYAKNISYEFFIFYFSRIHRYTSEKYSVFQLWVVEKYKNIMDIPYFRRIAEEYSVGVSVLLHSICPFPETFEYAENLNPLVTNKNKDSFAFSFALWLYNKRGYYYDNNLKK